MVSPHLDEVPRAPATQAPGAGYITGLCAESCLIWPSAFALGGKIDWHSHRVYIYMIQLIQGFSGSILILVHTCISIIVVKPFFARPMLSGVS